MANLLVSFEFKCSLKSRNWPVKSTLACFRCHWYGWHGEHINCEERQSC